MPDCLDQRAKSAISNRVHENGSSCIGNACPPSGVVSDSNAGVASEVWYGTGCAATAVSTAARISVSSGFIVSGRREQFSPTIVAPASAARWHAST